MLVKVYETYSYGYVGKADALMSATVESFRIPPGGGAILDVPYNPVWWNGERYVDGIRPPFMEVVAQEAYRLSLQLRDSIKASPLALVSSEDKRTAYLDLDITENEMAEPAIEPRVIDLADYATEATS